MKKKDSSADQLIFLKQQAQDTKQSKTTMRTILVLTHMYKTGISNYLTILTIMIEIKDVLMLIT